MNFPSSFFCRKLGPLGGPLAGQDDLLGQHIPHEVEVLLDLRTTQALGTTQASMRVTTMCVVLSAATSFVLTPPSVTTSRSGLAPLRADKEENKPIERPEQPTCVFRILFSVCPLLVVCLSLQLFVGSRLVVLLSFTLFVHFVRARSSRGRPISLSVSLFLRRSLSRALTSASFSTRSLVISSRLIITSLYAGTTWRAPSRICSLP